MEERNAQRAREEKSQRTIKPFQVFRGKEGGGKVRGECKWTRELWAMGESVENPVFEGSEVGLQTNRLSAYATWREGDGTALFHKQ